MPKNSKVAPEHKLKISSFKAHPHVLSQFQAQSVHKITMQSLINRALHLYVVNPEFRCIITSCTDLIPSGSL